MLERYLSDEDLRFAFERNLVTIGEAMIRMRDHDPETLASIPGYRGAIGLGNVVAHDYHQIEDTRIWGIVTEFLPILAKEVRELLRGAQP